MRVRLRAQGCRVARLFLKCFARCEAGGAGQRAHAAEKDEDQEEDAKANPAKVKVQTEDESRRALLHTPVRACPRTTVCALTHCMTRASACHKRCRHASFESLRSSAASTARVGRTPRRMGEK